MIEFATGATVDLERGQVVVDGVRFDAAGLRCFIAAAEARAVLRLEVGEGGESIRAERLETWPPAEESTP